ncbi:hypothetical protein GLOIN_2v1656063 [Rhizophagus irregularis DAOM 181602=DAOM 197198]|uniref:Uncharacterized protein n=1 Tax=Rhizophagus irregularis (strain DAOM 181602 / DAOM 197198 / MUCL 43194) TaxID=747089 RepID=A0A2P4PMF9_RHIID|nr:hypothetical protein GLOIN_2v1656063 [Rhizophagus irregularis DAOM 181602=DAOM 197198]POG66584.1 hypothetical protein GLOIN_2v1656063 [Rhizophagus irregularis DAOM 181602=DAOM 197198]|eukprot:XP_025173450.1 hypothetical protein GLOIN_2v1656063 [Rhizophagus irregularis DAOM 181602=DAOM 197198]
MRFYLILNLNKILISILVIIHLQHFLNQYWLHIFGLMVIGFKEMNLIFGLLIYILLLQVYFL